jgi:ribose-phosphate pyrophosphokinase
MRKKIGRLNKKILEADPKIKQLSEKLEALEKRNGNHDGCKKDELVLVAGNGNPELAKRISEYLGVPLTQSSVVTFADDEIRIDFEENVRLSDAYIIQSTSRSLNPYTFRENKENSVNDNIAELLLLIDTLKRSDASRITAVIPYYAYARQDRKVEPRVPIAAKAWAKCIEGLGTNRVIAVELHANQIQGFFDIPVGNLYASPVLLKYIKKRFTNNLVMVSPDAGGVKVARSYAKNLKAGLAIIDKNRLAPGIAKAEAVIGDVRGKTALLVDDMIDTAGTLTGAVEALLIAGATEVHAVCAHLVLSKPGVSRIENSPIISVVGTDTVQLREEALNCTKIGVVSLAHIIAEAILRSHEGGSVSDLFESDYNGDLTWVKPLKI